MKASACDPVCPTQAIFPEEEVPQQWEEYVALNKDLSKKWPVITEKRDPLPTAEEYAEKKGKRSELQE